MADNSNLQKPIGTQDWYDFIGIMAEGLQFIHMGGNEATDFLIENCLIDRSSKVLDVGSGGGYTACKIAREIGSQVTGIDISEVMVSKAKIRAKKEGVSDLVDFRTADLSKIPFDDGSFDSVLIESVLTPFSGDIDNALREIHRVLKPKGYLGINESFLKDDTPKEILEIVEKHPAMNEPFTKHRLLSVVKDAGFKVIEVKTQGQADLPNAVKQLGCGGLIKFLFVAYPKIIWKLITDKRIREASKIDAQITKVNKQYLLFALMIAKK